MALAQKRIVAVDGATRALWRLAENGDFEELAAVLPRVTNINARNEHGVTALMRAAQNGHVRMVRLLLEHGADANLKRNDRFTALALAAFFGHTDVVRALMEHGADSQASTRNGTSPQMWATARTFNEVVDQLEKPVLRTKPVGVVKKEAKLSAPKAVTVATSSTVVPRAPAVVRTLKDPPEIWDLVHEVPRGFDARSAFVTRLKSMQTGVAFRAAAALVLIGMCVVGVIMLRRAQARSERTVEPQPNVTAQSKDVPQPPAAIAAPAATQTAVVPEVVAPEVVAPQVVAPAINDSDKPVAVRDAVSKSSTRSHVAASNRAEPRATRITSEVVPPTAVSSEKSEPPPARVENPTNTTKIKPNVPLSPQLISPGKNSAPKTKVIQWP